VDVVAEKIPVETLNSDLARMDQKFKGKSKKRKKKRSGGDGRDSGRQNRNNRKPKSGDQR
jgi:hypothetical protein